MKPGRPKIHASSRERYKTWYAANREHVLQQRKLHRERHPELVAASQKRTRELYGSRYRRRKLARIYQTTPEKIDELMLVDACEICGRTDVKLSIDHDHATDIVRGRLCSRCNFGVGCFDDSPQNLRWAAEYIERNGDSRR